ncbi:hypothetical protein GCM10027282_11020 [Frigoribacterium salinisoli]
MRRPGPRRRLALLVATGLAAVAPVLPDGAAGHARQGPPVVVAAPAAVAQEARGTFAPRGASWSWPVPAPHPVLRPFVAPEHAWSPGHRGLDVGAAVDAVVLAPDDGVVHFSGVVVDRPVLSLRHRDGVLSSVEPVASDLVRGDAVERGQPIGVLRPGHCPDGPSCLHLGARVDGTYVSPLLFLGGGEPSVLLPTRR